MKQLTSDANAQTLFNHANAGARLNKIPRSLTPRTLRDQAITSQLWKAEQVARRLANKTGLRYSDLHGAACEAIVKIYESWKPEKGANFSTFVNRSLYFLMCNYLRDFTYLPKFPRQMSVDNLKLNKARRALPHGSYQDWANHTGFTEAYIGELDSAFRCSLSLDYPENTGDDY
jgi:DNA-directed RNA polymerase specialized sigma subunit